MGLVEPLPTSEVCPNCGEWCSSLLPNTGWCQECSVPADMKICPCGAFFPKSAQVQHCWACRKEAWFERNADRLEAYLARGFSLTASMALVSNDLRPTCLGCSEPIKGAREGRKFCRKKAECRSKAESFRTLRKSGVSPDIALAIAIGDAPILDTIEKESAA